jgi:hypothetical protein
MRATASTEPPGGNTEINLMGLRDGQSSAAIAAFKLSKAANMNSSFLSIGIP